MPSLISKYPLDLTGRSPANLVAGEKQLLLSRGNTPYRVVSFSQGGFYTPSLKVYDKTYKMLRKDVDYIATYKHADASAYTGMEICSTVVILNPAITGFVLLGGQLVGADFAFSLTAEDDTIAYLETLASGVKPGWAAYIGDEPQWQPGELQEERWERHHYGHLNASIERLTAAITSGNGVAEDEVRSHIKQRYNDFMTRFQGQITAHINDHANPHNVDKTDILLPLVENYPVANSATARAGTSAAHYLTQRGVYEMMNQFGEIPLNAHIAARYTTHAPTAAQLRTYTKLQLDDLFDKKLAIDGTAVGANLFWGRLLSAPGVDRYINQLQLYNDHRANLNAANFNSGKVAPQRLGIGTPTATSVLTATGVWTEFRTLYDRYTADSGTDIYYAGQVTLASIATTYADINYYPVGTIVIYLVVGLEGYAYGNGGNDPYNRASFRAAIRGAGGWFTLG